MHKYKRRNTARILVEQKPYEIKGNPSYLKIELFRGLILSGLVIEMSENAIKFRIVRTYGGLGPNDWQTSDECMIPRNTIKNLIDQI